MKGDSVILTGTPGNTLDVDTPHFFGKNCYFFGIFYDQSWLKFQGPYWGQKDERRDNLAILE